MRSNCLKATSCDRFAAQLSVLTQDVVKSSETEGEILAALLRLCLCLIPDSFAWAGLSMKWVEADVVLDKDGKALTALNSHLHRPRSNAFVGTLRAPQNTQDGDRPPFIVYRVDYPPVTDPDAVEEPLELQ